MFSVYYENELRAVCVYAEDAAMLVGCLGAGAQIRVPSKNHRGQRRVDERVLWDEGNEEQEAAESYDYVAEICAQRSAA